MRPATTALAKKTTHMTRPSKIPLRMSKEGRLYLTQLRAFATKLIEGGPGFHKIDNTFGEIGQKLNSAGIKNVMVSDGASVKDIVNQLLTVTGRATLWTPKVTIPSVLFNVPEAFQGDGVLTKGTLVVTTQNGENLVVAVTIEDIQNGWTGFAKQWLILDFLLFNGITSFEVDLELALPSFLSAIADRNVIQKEALGKVISATALTSARLAIDPRKCTLCVKCATVCYNAAIVSDAPSPINLAKGKARFRIDPERCKETCTVCIEVCDTKPKAIYVVKDD